ncbi:MAG: hypothetical protein AAGK97_14315, partial [Bacteroidota bacterium]
MKKLLHVLILFVFIALTSSEIYSQIIVDQDTLYGNEWIDFDKDYYKFQVAEDGVYRITYEALQSAGLALEGISGIDFQLFNLGKEVHLITSTDGVFGPDDYIDFYGLKNLDYMDQFLFEDPEDQLLNPQYSMYTDNNTYFLTLNQGVNNLRYTPVENDLTDLPEKEAFYMEDQLDINTGRFIKNWGLQSGVFFSHYTSSEGFGQNQRASHNETMRINQIYVDEDIPSQLEIRLGFNNGDVQTNQISVEDSLLLESTFGKSEVATLNLDVPTSLLDTRTLVNIRNTAGQHSVAYTKLTYPRKFNGNGSSSFKFNLSATENRRYIELANFEGTGADNKILDLNHAEVMPVDFSDNLIKMAIPASDKRTLVVYNNAAGVELIT